MEYQVGALTTKALELLEEKGFEKYKFTSYSQAFRFVDKLNEHFKCNCFRVKDVIENGRVNRASR
jgi:hypothetical protein